MSDWLPTEMRAAVSKLHEWQTVAVCLYGEARSEPIQGMCAVAAVMRNRVDAKTWFGEGWAGVVLKPWQFSMWHPNGGKLNYERVLTLATKLAAGEDVKDAKYLTCAWVARGAMGGFLPPDLKGADVKGANHYHTAVLSPRPEWAQNAVPVAQVASHVFYRL